MGAEESLEERRRRFFCLAGQPISGEHCLGRFFSVKFRHETARNRTRLAHFFLRPLILARQQQTTGRLGTAIQQQNGPEKKGVEFDKISSV